MNKYDKEFKNILNPTTCLTRMWKLLDMHPEDEKEIFDAFSKQDKKITHFELYELKDVMTEY